MMRHELPYNIGYLLEDDIYRYFEIDKDKYSTELKRKYFEKTQEYNDYKSKLHSLKRDVLANCFYIKIAKMGTYSLKDKRFYSSEVYIRPSYRSYKGFLGVSSNTPICLFQWYFYIDFSSILKVCDLHLDVSYDDDGCCSFVKISVSYPEDKVLELENNSNILFLFNLSGKYREYIEWNSNRCRIYTITEPQFVLQNEKTLREDALR